MNSDLEEVRKKLKKGLEHAYMNHQIGQGKERDKNYEDVEYLLLISKILEEAGDVKGARLILREIAKALPSVKLKTPK